MRTNIFLALPLLLATSCTTTIRNINVGDNLSVQIGDNAPCDFVVENILTMLYTGNGKTIPTKAFANTDGVVCGSMVCGDKLTYICQPVEVFGLKPERRFREPKYQ